MLYDLLAALFRPVAWWGRMRVEGLEHVPASGPLLVVPNHDSQWDPIVVGLAIKPLRRLRFLARASLWRIPGLGPLLGALGQIPIGRGAGDVGALERAVEALASGHVRFPRRPRVKVTFLRPAAGDPRPGEEAWVLSTRLLD